MSTTATCFENVFGLSRTGCECFTDTAPEDFDVSASALYLDETPGLNLTRIFSGSNCENTGWELMVKARAEGVRRFTNEALKHIAANTKQTRPTGRSIVARERGTKALVLSRAFHGVHMKFAWVRGGMATVNRIGGAFKFTGTVNVSVYDAYSEDPLYTRTITATENKHVWTDVESFVLPLSNFDGEDPEFWFLFEPTAGQQALNSKIAPCGCGGKAKWGADMSTCRRGVVVDNNTWTAWLTAGGVSGDALVDRDNWTNQNESQGLLIDLELNCDRRSTLCSGVPDYELDPLQATFAYGSRFAAALYLIEHLTGSTRVVRENIVNGDEMERLRVSYTKEMNDRAEYLGAELSEPQDEGNARSGVNQYSDCYACKEDGPRVQTIRR